MQYKNRGGGSKRPQPQQADRERRVEADEVPRPLGPTPPEPLKCYPSARVVFMYVYTWIYVNTNHSNLALQRGCGTVNSGHTTTMIRQQ